MKPEYLLLARQLRAAGCSYVEIGKEFAARYGFSPLVAMRLAHGWSQQDAADAWNRRWPDEPKTLKNFSYWENWRSPRGGYQPRLQTWDRLAQLLHCRVTDLLTDTGDYRETAVLPPAQSAEEKAAAEALARAERLQREVLLRWPHAFTFLDAVRERTGAWPPWCLLPSAAAALVTGWPPHGPPDGLATAVTALYSWRWSRSVYLYPPQLVTTLAGIRRRVRLGGVGPLRVLGEWCLYVAGGHPQIPGAGMWAFLDLEASTGAPLLCLLVDLADGDLDALVPVRLRLDEDPPTVVDEPSLGDAGRRRLITSTVDLLVRLVHHPAEPDTPLTCLGPVELARPRRLSHPAAQERVWTVGYRR